MYRCVSCVFCFVCFSNSKRGMPAYGLHFHSVVAEIRVDWKVRRGYASLLGGGWGIRHLRGFKHNDGCKFFSLIAMHWERCHLTSSVHQEVPTSIQRASK